MSSEIIEVLNALCEKLGVAVDWSAQNVLPQFYDLMDRYSRYMIARNVSEIVLSMMFIVLSIVAMRITYKSYKSNGWAKTCYVSDYYTDPVECCEISKMAWAIIGVSISVFLVAFFVIVVRFGGLIQCVMIPDIAAAKEIVTLIKAV